jgi:hypothetical protein
MNGIRSQITGTVFDELTVTDRNGSHRIKLDPENRYHRAVAQGLEENEIRQHHPHLIGMLTPDWKIKI